MFQHKSLFFTLAIFLLANFCFIHDYEKAYANSSPKTITITAMPKGYEWGDFIYLTLVDKKNQEMYLMLPSDNAEQILNIYKDKWVEIEYTVERDYFEGAGEEIDFEIIRTIDGQDVATIGLQVVKTTAMPIEYEWADFIFITFLDKN